MDVEVGRDEPDHAGTDTDDKGQDRGDAQQHGDNQAQHERRHEADELEPDNSVDRPTGRIAGYVELRLDLPALVGRCEAATRARQPAEQGLQELGQVAADLSLDPDGHDDPLEVLAVHPVGDAVERVLDLDPEPLLDHRPAEFTADDRVAFLHDGVDCLRQRETGLKRTRR